MKSLPERSEQTSAHTSEVTGTLCLSSVKSHISDGWAEKRVSGGGERIILICILSIQTSGSYKEQNLSLFKRAKRSHHADTWEKGLAMHKE